MSADWHTQSALANPLSAVVCVVVRSVFICYYPQILQEFLLPVACGWVEVSAYRLSLSSELSKLLTPHVRVPPHSAYR